MSRRIEWRRLHAARGARVSGRFVKQELWERWRAERILMSGSKQRGLFLREVGIGGSRLLPLRRSGGTTPGFLFRYYMQKPAPI